MIKKWIFFLQQLYFILLIITSFHLLPQAQIFHLRPSTFLSLFTHYKIRANSFQIITATRQGI